MWRVKEYYIHTFIFGGKKYAGMFSNEEISERLLESTTFCDEQQVVKK
jgi:hypothetical protein